MGARSACISSGELIVDPMCGAGIILLEAAQCWSFATYLGFDVDQTQLNRLAANRDLLSGRSRRGMHVVRGDATHLPLPDGCVDAIVCDLPFGKLFGSEAQPEPGTKRMALSSCRG